MSALPNEPLPVDWHVYRRTGTPGTVGELPSPPPWRRFSGEPVNAAPADDSGEADRRIGGAHGVGRVPNPHEIAMVNAAIYLRRPLLVTGRPGTGKSSLAYLISRELWLGPVLRWSITSRTTLKEGLYLYDAIGRRRSRGRCHVRSTPSFRRAVA
jgi:MoxR-like ATPase